MVEQLVEGRGLTWSSGGDERWREGIFSSPLTFYGYPLPVVHLDDANADFLQCRIESYNADEVHLLMSMLEVVPGSAHREGDLSILIGEWEGGGCWA